MINRLWVQLPTMHCWVSTWMGDHLWAGKLTELKYCATYVVCWRLTDLWHHTQSVLAGLYWQYTTISKIQKCRQENRLHEDMRDCKSLWHTYFDRRASWSWRPNHQWEMQSHWRQWRLMTQGHLPCYVAHCSWTVDQYPPIDNTIRSRSIHQSINQSINPPPLKQQSVAEMQNSDFDLCANWTSGVSVRWTVFTLLQCCCTARHFNINPTLLLSSCLSVCLSV